MTESNKTKIGTSEKIWFLIAGLFIVTALSSSVFAWYFFQRQVAASAPIDSPVSIYISASHMEDIANLDLSNIDMERADGSGNRYNYQDFAFSVQGEDISAFKLQLAYTTNNQLTFEIYEATESSGAGGQYTYYSSAEDALYSYTIDGSALTLRYLNAQAGNLLANNTLHTDTYGSYANVNQYAEPLYVQTSNAIAVRNQSGIEFHNYFILRVRWPAEKMNDRETDVLYIAARAGS